ncbi:flavin monoamine oxidase family protein [Derxia lacustris]|uniref:flavin monoamine oxidase family protein n=1 Tax=Derxia lacustris TaxID=764842 RepID=UPI000A16E042|nr:FAD-dependent oxidoreductase [Derxia lacustris]
MIETAIVGGGVCGLELAARLHALGAGFTVFEARDRIGGRVLTKTGNKGGGLDLGPTWFWPDTEPRIARRLDELGLASFPQNDTGAVMRLEDPNKPAEPAPELQGVHGGAHRIAGGSVKLVEALAAQLPAGSIEFGTQVLSIVDRGHHVEIGLRRGGIETTIEARRVVIALPPRLVAQDISFDPPLSGALANSLASTRTWMADQAKALVEYPSAFWRAAGQSGNAFVSHAQVMLHEIFDACDADASTAALGGFVALPPEVRAKIRGALPLLVSSQMVQVFGVAADSSDISYQDWSTERFTASEADKASFNDGPPVYGDALLRRAWWDGRLHFGGTETASYGAGHMEGALESAARILRALSPASRPASSTTGASAMTTEERPAAFTEFAAWVTIQRANAPERYKRLLTQLLSTQQGEQLTQRAVLGAVEQLYSEALARLQDTDLGNVTGLVVQGRSSLTPLALGAFAGFSKAMLDSAIAHNRTSCAISNFPDEAKPQADYIDVIVRDLAAAWREFAMSVNDLLLSKTGARETT